MVGHCCSLLLSLARALLCPLVCDRDEIKSDCENKRKTLLRERKTYIKTCVVIGNGKQGHFVC